MADAYWDQSASHHVYDALHDLIAGSDEPDVRVRRGRRPEAARADPGADLGGGAQRDLDPVARRDVGDRGRPSSVGAEAAFFYQPTVFTKKLLPDEQKYLTLDTLRAGALGPGDHAGA